MPYTFILSNRLDFREQLGNIVREETLYEPVCIPLQPQQKSDETKEADYSKQVALLKFVEHKIMGWPAEQLRESVLVADELISKQTLDPLIKKGDNGCFYAMLMLAFPELQFTFLNTRGLPNPKFHLFDWLDVARNSAHKKKLSTKRDEEWRNAMQISGYPDCQLFDPHGIRETIKNNINWHSEHKHTAPWFPKREHLALNLEDELSYALFNGYTAFKAGNKCKVVNCMAHLENLDKEIMENRSFSNDDSTSIEADLSDVSKTEGEKEPQNNFEIKLQYEDAYLGFYDKSGQKLSKVKQRYKNYPILNEENSKKFVITVGHNQDDLELPESVTLINKPGKGIYHLLKESGQYEQYKINRGCWTVNNEPSKNPDGKENISHSSPGRLLVIAESLLRRSAKILDASQHVSEAIHAATLAMEAKELLGSRTPTVALRALAMQHKAEITAESLFYGVEYEMDLSLRFDDIEAETTATSRWFTKSGGKDKKQQINASLIIVEQLAKEFNKWNQFDEELACLHEARGLKYSLFRKKFWGMAVLRPLHWYIQKCMKSDLNFVGFILAWVVIFGLLYHMTVNGKLVLVWGAPFDCEAFVSAGRFFVTFEGTAFLKSGLKNDIYESIILTFQGVVAFFHLTILATYIYTKLGRR